MSSIHKYEQDLNCSLCIWYQLSLLLSTKAHLPSWLILWNGKSLAVYIYPGSSQVQNPGVWYVCSVYPLLSWWAAILNCYKPHILEGNGWPTHAAYKAWTRALSPTELPLWERSGFPSGLSVSAHSPLWVAGQVEICCGRENDGLQCFPDRHHVSVPFQRHQLCLECLHF